jgi:IS30 family transposase
MKKMYEADYAQQQYKHTLRDSRTGISLSDQELHFIEDQIIPLIKNGVSVPVAHDAYADQMPVSVRTLYAYVDRGLFDVDNIDLRRKVRRKTGKKKRGPVFHVDKKCHVGRTYADFQNFIEKHPDVNVCEMDSVEGRKGEPVILTIFFRNCDLQLMYLRRANTAATVIEAFNWFRKVLDDDFKTVFPLLLADRGTEFTNPSAIEINSVTGKIGCAMFYCDPQQINQKSRCERNHEYLRYILPKGSSFQELKQEEVRLVMNHVNSMPRGSLNAKAPIQVFTEIYGEQIATRLGLKYIPLEQLYLKPELLKK